ncbi:hypothetical protein GYMLUDRAFT_140737, partial [Collybiopsis luxurians FD-317 M1]
LVKLSGKLFIFAATIVKWIKSGENGFEEQRLNDVLNLQPEASQTKELEARELDSLYGVIVEKAIGSNAPKEKEKLLKVLHSVITVRSPVCCEVIAQLTDVTPQQAQAFIAALGSVLYVGKAEAIYIFHASFSDFLLRTKSTDLHCDPVIQHDFLGNSCLNIMNKMLKFNMLSLPSSFLKDKEVKNIESAVDNKIKQILVYACKSWGYHLEKCTLKNAKNNANLMEISLQKFLEEKIVYWVEVMSVLQKFQQTIRSVKSAVETFLLSPANGMTPHWYLSILPFWKRDIAAIEQGLKMGSIVKRQMEKPNLSVWYAGSEINSIAISDNGESVVSGGDDNMVRIWNAKTGASIGEPLQGHSDQVWSVAFSPDGKRIVSGSSDKTVRIWNAETGAPIGDPLQGHTHSVRSVAFSPDGKRIVSSSSDETTVRIWNAETGAPIGVPLQGHTRSVWSVAFSPDGQKIVSGSLDETVRIWNAETGAPIGYPLQGHTDPVSSVAFSPDG